MKSLRFSLVLNAEFNCWKISCAGRRAVFFIVDLRSFAFLSEDSFDGQIILPLPLSLYADKIDIFLKRFVVFFLLVRVR